MLRTRLGRSPAGCLSTARLAPRPRKRRGNILILTAFFMIVMMAILALSVDTGYMYTMNTQLKRQVDSAALAGAGALVNGTSAAQSTAVEYLVRNPVGQQVATATDPNLLAVQLAEFTALHKNDYTITTGNWNPATMKMDSAPNGNPSTIAVTMKYPSNPLFFAAALGHKDFAIEATSIATFQPRDIQLVLDFSASMNDDSTFAKISALGQTAIEANLQECWTDLANPSYGAVMQFTPKWAVVQGAAQNAGTQVPHISVEYRNTSVFVTSDHTIKTVKLEFSNGNQQSWSPNSGLTGTFTGSGSNANKQVRKVWVKSWNNQNTFGTDGEFFDFTSTNMNTTLKKALGLNNVSYPYSGSWDEYIDWVESSSNQNNDAGYRYKFGYMNLLVFWFDQKPSYSQTPVLWKTHSYPVRNLKDSVSVFMDYLREVPSGDEVGLSIYDSSSGDAILEHALTQTLDDISNIVSLRQAGHYTQYTNIAAGLQNGRQHLQSNARTGAVKLIVLMTDGEANLYNGQYDEGIAKAAVITEANACKAAGYKVMTISLGTAADTALMQQVADITKGKHFNVPGGSTVTAMRDQLLAAFREIANARPLKLVQ